MPRAGWPDAVGLAAGVVADAVLADPRRGHPVAAFGRLAAVAENHVYRDSRVVGAGYAAGLVLAASAPAAVVRLRPTGLGRVAAFTLATWAVLGGTSLRREAAALGRALASDDPPEARRRIRSLCGRDPEDLAPDALVRATVESVAENTCDAVVGPLFWGAVAGMPGLLAYRAVNTLDAMVGHRSPHYERFGWAAARADDVANLVPARLSAVLAMMLCPLVGGRPVAALGAWRRDGRKHPSPNAGCVEAAFAGALGRSLGGRLAYDGRVEDRPQLGSGPAPEIADIARAARLSAAVGAAAALLAVTARLARDTDRR